MHRYARQLGNLKTCDNSQSCMCDLRFLHGSINRKALIKYGEFATGTGDACGMPSVAFAQFSPQAWSIAAFSGQFGKALVDVRVLC